MKIIPTFQSNFYQFLTTARILNLLSMNNTATIARIILMYGSPFFTGFLMGWMDIGPKFLGLGILCKNSSARSRSSSFSLSCWSSWQPLSNRWYSLNGFTFWQINRRESSQLVTVSSLPWKIFMGKLKLSQFFMTWSMASNMYLAILMDMKGSIIRSSKIVCRYFVFFVSAVGLTREFTIKSERSSPKQLMAIFLIQLKCMLLAKPSRGLVTMHPLTEILGLSISSLMATSPPMLWAQRNRGIPERAVLSM